MGEFLKDNYFTGVRIILMLVLSIYGIAINDSYEWNTGVSVKVLLLVSLFISLMALKELVGKSMKRFFMIGAIIVFAFLIKVGGSGYILLGVFLILEILYLLEAPLIMFIFPFITVFYESPIDSLTLLVVVFVLTVCYVQHIFIVTPYRKQVMEETKTQQGLKRDMETQENASREELKKNRLQAENKMLEERANLSQTLHDKLGHNINGSIYQLEASKVIMDKEPEKARSMIQAVIDQLRTGMDEIRAILRKERPEKQQMAMLQLYELCEDCNKKGVEAEFEKEGDLSAIPDSLWEIILDNAFEAVTNSMKYSKCNSINIKIIVMNKMVRCVVRDDGIGCDEIVDGMGLSGMRKRVRSVGGNIDFNTHPGFEVSMLLPLE